MPRTLSVAVSITDPKAMYTNFLAGASADSFIAINAGVDGAGESSTLSLNDGANLKNNGPNDILIKTSSTSHGADTGYLLLENEELFIEIDNLSDLFVKNNASNAGISYSVYAN